MLLTKAYEEYKDYLKGVEKSKKTIEGYYQDLNFFSKWLHQKYNCPIYLEDVIIGEIEEFLKMLKDERNYKPQSRKRVAASIKMFFKFAYKKKLITTDIATDIEPIKVVPKEREYLTEDEVIEFAEAISHKVVKVMVYTMFYAGLRVSEATNLKVEDVDLEKRQIKVIAGKGNKNRTIPINDKLYEILKEYSTWRIDSEYFFATKKTGKISKVRVEAIVRETREKLGIKKQVTPHTFRHSFASRLVEKNVNIVSISKLLGHSDIKVTSVYTHTNMNQLTEAVNMMWGD